MKRIVALFLAITLSPIMNITLAANKDEQGHTLVSLWKSYYSAVDKDKPKEQASILESIKKEAAEKRLSWDYYDACQKYVNARVSSNWKLRDELEAQKEKDLDTYNDPFVNFFRKAVSYPSAAGLLQYIELYKDKLKQTYNPEFYTRDGRVSGCVFSNALVPLITNDYDFALWHTFLLDYSPNSERKAEKLLRERYGNEYPFAGFADYCMALRTYDKDIERENLNAFVAKYNGKAVSLLGRQDIIDTDFDIVSRKKDRTGKDYEKIKAACEKFIADKKSFSGSEKAIANCCTIPESILDRMNEKFVHFDIQNSRLSVFTQNVSSFKFQILDGKKVIHEKTIENKKHSYYATDTTVYDIPQIPDGEYLAKCIYGKDDARGHYEKYTLSLATKQDAYGHAVYVTDFLSGKPLDKVNLTLCDHDGEVVASANDVLLDGFTYLPAEFEERLKRERWGDMIFASTAAGGTLRKSQSQRLSFRDFYEGDEKDHKAIRVFTDRSAYNPDETLHYKAIMYRGLYNLETMAGVQLKATLSDAEGKKIDSAELTTNEFGSAAGEFVLKRGSKNGNYTLEVTDARGNIFDSKRVTVDDFVLPSFNLDWDVDKTLHLPGEEICVSGKIKSYSGHPVTEAKGEYKVTANYGQYKSGEVKFNADGTFKITFTANDNNYCTYVVVVKITDSTGETLEFSTSTSSYSELPLYVTLSNSVRGSHYATLSSDVAEVLFNVNSIESSDLAQNSLKITYELQHDGKTISSGSAKSGEKKKIDFTGKPNGKYVIVAVATAKAKDGKTYTRKREFEIYKVKDTDTSLGDGITNFFKETADEIGVQIGHCGAPVWAVAELYGTGNRLLQKKMVTLSGKNNLKTVSFDYKAEYPDVVTLKIFYFLNGRSFSFDRTVYRKVNKLDLPLSFSRFLDTTKPGATYTFNIKTAAGVECAATIFDKSTETIRTNVWPTVAAQRYPAPSISFVATCGYDGAYGSYYNPDNEFGIKGMKASGGAVREMAKAAVESTADNAVFDGVVEEEAIPFQLAEEPGTPDGYIRENFANTIAWEPFLRSDKDGNISFKFTNADKLSTYYVQLFAHNQEMKNASLRKEMVVTIPVKIAVVEPQVLYTGDKFVLRVSLANSLKKAVSGRLAISFLNGGTSDSKAISNKSKTASIPAMGNASFDFPIDVPAVETLGLKIVFTAEGDYGSDGVFVAVPVGKPVQEITEAHSSILLAGQDREALIKNLRSQFVNVKGSEAALKEISIIDMVREALPTLVTTDSDNSINLVTSLYANYLISKINKDGKTPDAEVLKKLKACQNRNGGFGWFEGMDSSPILTLVILERFAAMEELQKEIDVIAAVKYLDETYLGDSKRPYWCGSFSQEQYLYLRSLYPNVSLDTDRMSMLARRAFKKANKEYLIPAKARGLNGQILAKARRLQTLRNLLYKPHGKLLAESLGISSSSKLEKSIQADIESLLEYAEPHKSGGQYYPNAVMPWRGLLESELYAHSILCDLFDECGHKKLADDIRLWIMVQKETQKWDDDPAYIEAIASVLRGSQSVLQTKVVVLSATTTLPFADIKPAGNGFKLERTFYRDGVEIKDGDQLNVGDKIVAKFKIWNEENRSFVRLTAPRSGALRPVQQLSGRIGWHLRPLQIPGWMSFSPQGYRNVLKDRTEFWFDSYPEENTTLEEEYFVTQAGTFQSPVPVIESLYAPHYRANSTSSPMTSK